MVTIIIAALLIWLVFGAIAWYVSERTNKKRVAKIDAEEDETMQLTQCPVHVPVRY